MREYLELDDAGFGAASEVMPKFVSPSDPAAQMDRRDAEGPAFFAYADNYLIDFKFGIIMDVKAGRAIRRQRSVQAKTMTRADAGAFRDQKPLSRRRYGVWLCRIRSTGSINEKKIAPHIPVIDQIKARGGTFSRENFRFSKKQNIISARRQSAYTTGHIGPDHALRYQASLPDCRACVLKPKCCPNMPARRIVRDVERGMLATLLVPWLRARLSSDRRRHRKSVEMLFAHLKRHLAAWAASVCAAMRCAR